MEVLDWLPYGKRYYYPGMSALDRAIWERFIAAYPDAYDECCYNVAVGEGTTMDTIVAPDTGGDVNRLYQRKIDVIGRKGQSFTVLEIGPRASTAKIGQVRAYKTLAVRDIEDIKDAAVCIVTDAELPEMRLLTAADNVGYVVV